MQVHGVTDGELYRTHWQIYHQNYCQRTPHLDSPERAKVLYRLNLA